MGHMLTLFGELLQLFSKVAVPVYVPIGHVWGFHFSPHLSQYLSFLLGCAGSSLLCSSSLAVVCGLLLAAASFVVGHGFSVVAHS